MIDINDRDGTWVITLNREDKANALTASMLEDLIGAVGQAQAERALVLTGAGRVFSAGADLDAARAGLATSPLWEDLSGSIASLPCLTIAALNGTVAGGAMGMVVACDLRIAVPTAKFFYPVMKHGFLPQPSDPKRLAELIGPSRTKLLLMAGQKFSAQDALSFGLVDRIVEGSVVDEAKRLAEDCCAADPKTARAIKSLCP